MFGVIPLLSDDEPAVRAPCARATSWADAGELEDGIATVRGPVVGSTYAVDTKAKPTYLDLGLEFPDPDRFTVVIFGEDRENFPTPPEDAYDGREIAVSGEVSVFNGVRQIIANHPNDITLC